MTVDVWAQVTARNRSHGLGRLIETAEGDLALFNRAKGHELFRVSSINEQTRTATLDDGSELRWRRSCAGCSQPASLRGPARALLATLEPQVAQTEPPEPDSESGEQGERETDTEQVAQTEPPDGDTFDPAEHTVEAVLAHIDEHPDDADRVLSEEAAGKARLTILNATF